MSLSEPESYAGGRFISPGRVTLARKVDGKSPDQKQSPRSLGYEAGLLLITAMSITEALLGMDTVTCETP